MRLKQLTLFFIFAICFVFVIAESSLSVIAQSPTATPVDCEPQQTFNDIMRLPDPFGDKPAYVNQLAAIKAMVDAQLEACKAKGLVPSPTETPTLPEGVTPTATSTLSAQGASNATRTVVAQVKTSTQVAKAATATLMAGYKPIDPRELTSYADKHIDENVIVQGTIFNIDGKIIQIYANGSYDNPVFINLTDEPSGVYKGDYVVVYGTVFGSYEFQNQQGNTISQPRLDGAFIKPKQ